MATRRASLSFAIQRFKGFWNQFRKSKRGIIGTFILLFFVVLALAAPIIAPHDPMKPQAEVGEWPRYGPGIGRRVAMELCYPEWYKYLPNIPKGEVIMTEEFYSIVVYHSVIDYYEQSFGSAEEWREKGIINATNTYILLSRKVSKMHGITATLPNGTTKVFNSSDYEIDARNPREINVKSKYGNFTTYKVSYSTGLDVVENIKVVQDSTFKSPTSKEEWTLRSLDSFEMSYDNNKGFNGSTGNYGCLALKYTPPDGVPNPTAKANLSTSFVYPYWEPPRWLLGHLSFKLEGASNATITIYINRKEGGHQYFLKTIKVNPSSEYIHEIFDIFDNQTRKTLNSENPQDIVFAYPANYTFQLSITFNNPSTDATMYLDNVHCILYGNVYGLLGTDNEPGFPRDIFSSLVYGTRISLVVGVLSALFSTLIGLFLGLVSGYVGGIVDEGIMRFADLLLVLPTLPLFIVLIVALSSIGSHMGMWNIIILITFFGWMGFARGVRSMVISLRERAFVEAAKASGGGTMHIINRHILPNVFSLVYITLATSVPGAIITEASLSWLGLGDRTVASWGKMLYDFQIAGVATTKGLGEYWFWVFPACISIALLATAFILIGYALDEILNPRLRERR